jgi:AAHS family 3-hydroxyphenylpropionic acid transporter
MAERDSSKRWAVLGIAWAAFFGIALGWYTMPTLQPQLVETYEITPQQFRLALTVPFLIAAILSIPGGMIADRLGIKRAASIGIAIAGVGFLLRSIDGGYLELIAAMITVGIGLGLIMPNLPKLVNIWFPPAETGLATGIYNTGLMAGISTGLIVAPFLPSWSSGNLLFGSVILALAVLFFLIVEDTPPGTQLPSTNLIEGLQHAVRSKNAWIAAMAVFAGLTGMVAIQGEFPVALLETYGIDTATGGQITSLITYGGVLGSLTIPTIANKLDRRKAVLVTAAVGFAVVEFPVWLSGDTTILFVGTAIAGYLAGGALPIIMEVPAWLPRVQSDPVKAQHVGGASGLMTAMMNLGGFVGLPLIIGPTIGAYGYTVGFAVAMIIFSFQGILGVFFTLPEIAE